MRGRGWVSVLRLTFCCLVCLGLASFLFMGLSYLAFGDGGGQIHFANKELDKANARAHSDSDAADCGREPRGGAPTTASPAVPASSPRHDIVEWRSMFGDFRLSW